MSVNEDTDLSPRGADMARLVAHKALSRGMDMGLSLSVAVVDESGHLLAFVRSDEAFLGSIAAALAKAKTALYFRRETGMMQKGLETGKTSYLALHGALPLEGGVPIFIGRRIVGALGVSGADSKQDGELARATLDSLGMRWEGS